MGASADPTSFGLFERLATVERLVDNLPFRARLKSEPETFADHLVVIGEQDTNPVVVQSALTERPPQSVPRAHGPQVLRNIPDATADSFSSESRGYQ